MLDNDSLKISWSYFHFSPLQRVAISLPAIPVNTNGIRGMITNKIEAIQVGPVTPVVPPRAVIPQRAVIPPRAKVSLGTIYIWCIIVVSILS